MVCLSDLICVLSENQVPVSKVDRHKISELVFDRCSKLGFVLLLCMQAKPRITWEIYLALSFTLLNDRRTHQGSPDQELCLQHLVIQQGRVLGEFKVEWTENCPRTPTYHELPVVRLQNRVTKLQVLLAGLKHHWSQRIRLLVDRIELVVVPGEWVQRAQLEESGTDLLSCIASESADIATHHLHTPHIHHEVTPDGQPKEGEVRQIVSSPMKSVPVAPESVTSADYEGSPLCFQKLVGGLALHHSKEDVGVGLKESPEVSGVEGNRNHFYVLAARMIGNVVGVVDDSGS